MDYEWDTAKAERNARLRGLSFEVVRWFDWKTATIWEDDRRDYGEDRRIALGMIGSRVHVVVYADRGAVRRIISLRKANVRETRHYEEDRDGTG